MVQIVLIGLGAGAAAALLFASIATGSALATFLFYLAALPILIAAIGWSHWAGLLAAFTAATSLGVILGFYFFTAFLIGVGLPAWWLGYLALLARQPSNGAGTAVEWYPVGRLVMWSAIIGALLVIVAVPNFGTDKESFQSALRNVFERALRIQMPAPADGPDPLRRPEVERLISVLVTAIPAAAAVLSTLINIVNLWLASRIAQVSGRLRRPWPDIASMTLPAYAPGLLAAAIAGTFLPDLAGVVAGIVAAALLMAYALLGFAVLHSVTRGIGSRALALGAAYASVVVLGWPILAMSMLGLADAAFDIRNRVARKRGPGPPTLTT